MWQLLHKAQKWRKTSYPVAWSEQRKRLPGYHSWPRRTKGREAIHRQQHRIYLTLGPIAVFCFCFGATSWSAKGEDEIALLSKFEYCKGQSSCASVLPLSMLPSLSRIFSSLENLSCTFECNFLTFWFPNLHYLSESMATEVAYLFQIYWTRAAQYGGKGRKMATPTTPWLIGASTLTVLYFLLGSKSE